MGSISIVKEEKKSPEHIIKNILLEVKLNRVRMGNLCSMGTAAAAKKVIIAICSCAAVLWLLCNVLPALSFLTKSSRTTCICFL